MSYEDVFQISFGHLQDVLARCLACLGKTSLRHLVDVFLPTGKCCKSIYSKQIAEGGTFLRTY